MEPRAKPGAESGAEPGGEPGAEPGTEPGAEPRQGQRSQEPARGDQEPSQGGKSIAAEAAQSAAELGPEPRAEPIKFSIIHYRPFAVIRLILILKSLGVVGSLINAAPFIIIYHLVVACFHYFQLQFAIAIGEKELCV